MQVGLSPNSGDIAYAPVLRRSDHVKLRATGSAKSRACGMRFMLKQLRLAMAMLLMNVAAPARAEPVTFHGIMVDKPETWTVSETDGGMKLVSADGAVDIWFEAYLKGEHAALVNEWIAFWQKNDVAFTGEPTVGSGETGGFTDSFRIYRNGGATWKGAPTVVEFTEIGPVGADGEMVQMTL